MTPLTSGTAARGRRLRPGRCGLLLLGAFTLAALAGCHEDEVIRHYQVTKTPEPAPKVRLLAVMFPHGEQTWFFKLAGPIQAVDDQARDFIKFVESVRFPDGKDEPTWTLPATWKEEAGDGPMRYKTIRLGPDDRRLEMTVTRLGREAGSLTDNVNRWRRLDLGLPPVSGSKVRKVVQELKIGGDTAYLVKMAGPGVAKAEKRPRGLPAGHPPFPGGRKPLTYRKPNGWKDTGARGGVVPIVASFRVGEGDRAADVTVIPLAANSGSLLANVNRWRGQVGLPELGRESDLEKDVRKIAVGGKPADYVDLAGPSKRMLAVVAPHGGRTWFIKMLGPTDVVGKEKPAFEAFVKSVQFDGGRGAADE